MTTDQLISELKAAQTIPAIAKATAALLRACGVPELPRRWAGTRKVERNK